MNNRSVPKYFVFRIYFTGIMIYLFLVISVWFFIFIKNTPNLMLSISSSLSESVKLEFQKRINNKVDDLHKNFDSQLSLVIHKTKKSTGEFVQDLIILSSLLLGLFLTFIFNFPIKYVFYLKRKNREIPEKIFNYTKKHLLRSPFINALILICSLTIGHIFFLIFALNLKGQNEFILSMVWQIFFISIIASYLFVLLIFFWHRSRVQRFYIDHIFTKDELKKKIDTKFKMSISKRLVISSLMTTIFPLATVLFYVLLSFSISHNIGEFDNSQLRLLFGDIVKVFDNLGITNTVFDSIHSSKTGHNLKILYINGINSIEMLIGILNGTIISLLYVFLFVRWTKKDIVSPIRELLSNMEKTKNGDLESFSIVRTNDEIGDLTEGYNSMLKGLQEREKIKHLFGQYLTKEISDEILKGNINLNGESYQATVMFCDIRDFTSISEKITTVEVFSFLNCYLDRMIDVILENNGIIDKFIGDGILAIFGVPVRSDNHSEDAVRSAFAMQKALKELNDDRIKNGQFPIKIGIGVHTGHLIAGNIGNSKKLEYTVIGDTVNIASRIEKLTKEYSTSLLISETTFNNLKPGFVEIEKAKKISDIEIRGKNERFNLYLW